MQKSHLLENDEIPLKTPYYVLVFWPVIQFTELFVPYDFQLGFVVRVSHQENDITILVKTKYLHGIKQ